jgi:Fe-S-cluster containining protein
VRSKTPLPIQLPALTDQLRQGMKDLYNVLDNELAKQNFKCEACGRCCHLVKWDHEIWLTQMELSYLIEEHGLRRTTTPGVCPYLENNQCIARSGRTLGCRVFHCSVNQDVLSDIYDKYFRLIKELALANCVELFYGELLASLDHIRQV